MLTIGSQRKMTWIVEKKHLASSFGSGLSDVLATPVLVGFCEECCRKLVDPSVSPGQQTVGTNICLQHTAATPMGMKVTVRATLVGIDDRRLQFEVDAADPIETIATATHERFIIDTDRFIRRIQYKESKRRNTVA